MDRVAYNNCMKPYMTGGGEDRKLRFCVGAKLCSRKSKTEEEARAICIESAANPKPAKEPKTKRPRVACTLKDLGNIAACITAKIDLSTLTTENMQTVFSEALETCAGGKREKKRLTSAQAKLAEMDPQQIKALETIAVLSQQAEGREW